MKVQYNRLNLTQCLLNVINWKYNEEDLKHNDGSILIKDVYKN